MQFVADKCPACNASKFRQVVRNADSYFLCNIPPVLYVQRPGRILFPLLDSHVG